MINRRSMTLSTLALLASPAVAATPRPAAPTETVWKPADTPPGGVAWSLLESTQEVPVPGKDGVSRANYPPGVRALNGKKVKVAGYMMTLENGPNQTHFVLLAYPPDCPYHTNPSAVQFIEVTTKTGIPFDYKVKVVEGVLQLTGQGDGGIFYKMVDGMPA